MVGESKKSENVDGFVRMYAEVIRRRAYLIRIRTKVAKSGSVGEFGRTYDDDTI